MPEPSAQVKNAIDPADYDIGSTNIDVSKPDGMPTAPAPRDRNPDGTYKALSGSAPAEAEAGTTPPQSSHPQYLVELAKDFGFDDADIAAMSPDALGRAVRRMRSQDVQRQASLSKEAAVVNPSQAPPPPVVEEPEPEFNEADYDPVIANTIKISRAQAKELKEVKAKLAAAEARETDRSNRQSAELVDDAFASLGAEYEAYFGKGTVYEVKDKDPDAFRRRVAVLRETGLNTHTASGKKIAAALKAEADRLFKITPKPTEPPDPYTESATGTPRVSKAQWDAAGTAKPTQRNGAPEPDGEAKAIRNLEAKLHKNGKPGGPATAAELDGFPD